ncbi:gliding motility-associated C-terminal domain-containing protein [Luteirhabdus pelagi]|uniref:gliding motility-associated C-terminal domain-containing protein n=1 Tax=Luteirhabdus pelagi TaxID=2792783 RepID=UPI00193982A4|nr:gliding motility-associated C-terminal domain-containing protein [Luteirhabdus pelagi]
MKKKLPSSHILSKPFQAKISFTFLLFLLTMVSGLAQTTIVCADGPVNNTYCYDENDTTAFEFQSDTGFPLTVVFNAGTVEQNFDELLILDSDGVTDLNAATPYGDGGELAGLSYTSTGDIITVQINSDISNSCVSGGQTPWDFDVFCASCINPTVSYALAEDCDNDQFFIDVTISDLGSGTSYTITDNEGIANETVTETGTYTVGPYIPQTDIVVEVSNDDDPNCVVTSESITSFCIEEGPCEFIEAGPDVTVDCDENCTDLEAEIFAFPGRETSSYLINGPICDLPPIDGGTPTNLTIDDQWTAPIDITFPFNFYGNEYTELVIGANGQISFDTSLAGGFNDWGIEPGELLPINNSSFPFNTIFGAFHDMDPGVNPAPDRINYFITGTAPFRIFVLNFNAIPQFSCNDISSTQQIVLYETYNVVEVNIIEKPVCPGWNDGLATLGLQGNDLTEFSVPPGRNTGVWEVLPGESETWRFVPNGAQANTTVFEWRDEAGTVISNDLTVNVCPTETTTYTAALIYEDDNGEITEVTDDVTVTAQNLFTVDLGGDQEFCGNESYDITATLDGVDPADVTFEWSTGEDTQTITVTESGTYTVEVTFENCTVTESVTITLFENPEIELGDDINTCFEEPVILDATPSNYDIADVIFEWTKDGDVIVGETDATLVVVDPGTYGVTVTAGDCSSTDSITVTESSDLEVAIQQDSFETCPDIVTTLTAVSSDETATYTWFENGDEIVGETSNTLDVSLEIGQVGAVTYTVQVSTGGCFAEDEIDIMLYDNAGCIIPEGLSPTGTPGQNDVFDLTFLADRTRIESFRVFNRQGRIVYEKDDYVNEWRGQSMDSNKMPSSTYYYIIIFDGEDPIYGTEKSGWVYINQDEN